MTAAVLSPCHGPRKAACMLRQPAKPEPNGAPDRSSADSLDMPCGLRGRSDAACCEGFHELVHQERHAARRTHAGRDEDRIGDVAELRFHQPCNSFSRERTEANNLSG